MVRDDSGEPGADRSGVRACHGVKSLPDLRAGRGCWSVGPPRVLQAEGRSGSRKARRLLTACLCVCSRVAKTK